MRSPYVTLYRTNRGDDGRPNQNQGGKDILKTGPAARTIRDKIPQYASNPDSLRNNVTALKGTNLLRLRVRSYRVIFAIVDDTMDVQVVGHRRDVYD